MCYSTYYNVLFSRQISLLWWCKGTKASFTQSKVSLLTIKLSLRLYVLMETTFRTFLNPGDQIGKVWQRCPVSVHLTGWFGSCFCWCFIDYHNPALRAYAHAAGLLLQFQGVTSQRHIRPGIGTALPFSLFSAVPKHCHFWRRLCLYDTFFLLRAILRNVSFQKKHCLRVHTA